MMDISIVVSMYRTEKHLRRFLKDVRTLNAELSTQHVSYEIILVANDATSSEYVLLSDLPSHVRVLHVGREPIYTSWNRGIRESQGTYVTFWGVDDTRYAKAIIDGVAALNDSKADIVAFPFRYYRFVKMFGFSILAKVKTFSPAPFAREKYMREMHLGPHFIVRKSLFERIGMFDETFKIAGDFAFQVKAVKSGGNILCVSTISGIFRNDGTTLSGSRAAIHAEENRRATL